MTPSSLRVTERHPRCIACTSHEQLLIDPPVVDVAKLVADELEETTCAIEDLPHTGWWKPSAMAEKLDIETRIEELPQRLADPDVFDGSKMYCHMAAAGILTEYCRAEIPACVAVARQAVAIETSLEWRGCKHWPIIQIADVRGHGNLHARTSGGR